jgi:2-C-methyl-D-erythritol 4-phosphate cytidylyltransferase
MTVALIVAAGSGERLGADRPKALVELAGRPLYEWSVLALQAAAGVDRIAVAAPPGHDLAADPEIVAVPGGATRSESVRRALAAAGPGDPVLVHDAARPLLTAALVEAVVAALGEDPSAACAIAAVPVTDTIKRADADRVVNTTLERSELWSVQTPQVFRRDVLERALDVPADELARATDDAWLVERIGGKVIVVPAIDENLKVTTPLDLQLAQALLAQRAQPRA